MDGSRKILLLIDRSREYGRGLVRGMAKYSRLYGPWTFWTNPEPYIETIEPLDFLKKIGQKADGIIMYEHPDAMTLIDMGVPVILANSPRSFDSTNVMTLGSDPKAVIKKAVEHLVDRGFTSLAFYGPKDIAWVQNRFDAFKRITSKFDKTFYYTGKWPTASSIQEGEGEELIRWLRSLPKPTGIIACNDDMGRIIIDTCRLAKLKVPDEIAVIGIDNDTILCELCNPPLSSIPLNTEKAGYEAAKFLDGKMSKAQIKKGKIIVPVLEPIERVSTDIQATEDSYVSNALRFIRRQTHNSLQVVDVAVEVGLNRRSLERKFRKIVQHGINDEIRRVRVRAISRLLMETDMSITEIAHELKFTGIDHIARYFKKEMGISPLEYRKQNR